MSFAFVLLLCPLNFLSNKTLKCPCGLFKDFAFSILSSQNKTKDWKISNFLYSFLPFKMLLFMILWTFFVRLFYNLFIAFTCIRRRRYIFLIITINSLFIVVSVFPISFVGLFFFGIRLLGIFLMIVFMCLNPFSSKKIFVILSVGKVMLLTLRLPTT